MNTDLYRERREKLRRVLLDKGIEALLVSHAANRYYLSGFELHDPQCNESSGWIVIAASGRDCLFTDPRYTDAAKRVWDENDLFIYSADKFTLVPKILKDRGVNTLAFEPRSLHVYDHTRLAEALTLRPADNLVEDLRVIKDADEIRRMDASIELNHQLFEYIERQLIPGKTEEEISWEIERFFRESGAQSMAFPSIVGVGPNAALPHAIPGTTPLRDNELVLIDTGCRFMDYNSDQTRTFWVGDKPSARFLETMELVRAAQQAAIDIIRPGLPLADAYRAAYSVFERQNVEKLFTHGLGHGVGLETHEPPSLSRVSTGTLKPGMVVTVEPGLYDPDWGGIRWEYQVLVTQDGCKVM